MTPSIRIIGITSNELGNFVEAFVRVAYAVGNPKRADNASNTTGSVLTWDAGIMRRGDLVIHRGEEQSIVQIIETSAGSTKQIEMAWPTYRLPDDEAGNRDLVRRVVSMAMLVAMEERDAAADPTRADHVAAETALRSEAVTVNDITGTYRGGAMTVMAATPWTSALVRLMESEHELQSTAEMVVVKRTTNQFVDIVSIMPHVLTVEIPDRSGSE